jgi:hypothetical protein
MPPSREIPDYVFHFHLLLRPRSKLMSPDPYRFSRISVHSLVKQNLFAQMLHVQPQHVPEYQVLP